MSINLASRECRRHLLYAAHKLLLQHLLNHRAGDMRGWIGGVDFCLKVERRRGGSEGNLCHIFLHVGLQLIDLLGHLAGAHNQHTRRQGVEGAGMPHFQLLDAQAVMQLAADAFHHIKRCPAQWFVEVKHLALYRVKHIPPLPLVHDNENTNAMAPTMAQ